jgi:hypothetical protein
MGAQDTIAQAMQPKGNSEAPLLWSAIDRSHEADNGKSPKKIEEQPAGRAAKSRAERGSIFAVQAPEATGTSQPPAQYWHFAVLSVVCGGCSVVPYNLVLAEDSGSPAWVSFATHLFVIVVNIHTIIGLVKKGLQLPWYYHGLFVALSFAFNFFRTSAFAGGQLVFCHLIMNLQMAVGAAVKGLGYGERYTMRQLTGCGLVSAGIAWAVLATTGETQKDTAEANASVLTTGALMMGFVLCRCFLSIYVQKAFEAHGEQAEEQVLFMHLLCIPLFMVGSQWAEIGPRGWQYCTAETHRWLLMLVLCNVALTYGETIFRTYMVARCPNLVTIGLVETLKRFSSLLLTTLMSIPANGWPKMGFWYGFIVLVIGTVTFLLAEPKKSKKA